MLAPIALVLALADVQAAPAAPATAPQAMPQAMPLPSSDEVVSAFVAKTRERQAKLRDEMRRYAYTETEKEEMLDKKGAVVETTTKVVSVVATKYGVTRRTISIDGKEPPRDVALREERQEAAMKKAWEEKQQPASPPTPPPASPRPPPRQGREVSIKVDDLLKLTRFSVVGREDVDGFGTLHLHFEPQPDADPGNLAEKLVLASAGDLWIDEADYHLVRATARSMDNVHVMGLLGNLQRFALDAEFRPAREGDEVWLPRRIEAEFAARILFKHARARVLTTFSDFQRASVTTEEEVGAPADPTSTR